MERFVESWMNFNIRIGMKLVTFSALCLGAVMWNCAAETVRSSFTGDTDYVSTELTAGISTAPDVATLGFDFFAKSETSKAKIAGIQSVAGQTVLADAGILALLALMLGYLMGRTPGTT
jgi:hypothetical protein